MVFKVGGLEEILQIRCFKGGVEDDFLSWCPKKVLEVSKGGT